MDGESTSEALVVNEQGGQVVKPDELGTLSGEAIEKYFNAAADHLMEIHSEVSNTLTSLLSELKATSDSAREIGKLEAQRTIDATMRMKNAVEAIQAVRTKLNGSD